MSMDKLQNALGDVQDEFILDAHAEAAVKRFGWVKWAAVAACLAIVAAIAIPVLNSKASKAEDQPDDTEQQDTAVPDGYYGGGSGLYDVGESYNNFATYEEFATLVEDPIFEAFSKSDEAKQYDHVYYSVTAFEIPEKDYFWPTYIRLHINPIFYMEETKYFESDPMVTRYFDDWRAEGNFPEAKKQGVLTEYEVNGFEAQKYEKHQLLDFIEGWYEARVRVGEVWYHVEGTDEAEVDSIIEMIAHFAGELDEYPTDPEIPTLEPDDEDTDDTSNGVAGEWSESFTNYDEFAAYVEEPVFEAFANSAEGQRHDIAYLISGSSDFPSSKSTDDLASVSMLLDCEYRLDTATYYGGDFGGPQYRWFSTDSSVSIKRYYNALYTDDLFERAEPYGVVTSIEVNGCEVQEVDPNDYYTAVAIASGNQDLLDIQTRNADTPHAHWARVNIDGVWYIMNSNDEGILHDIAVALAEVAG